MFFVENLEAKLLCWNICKKLKAKVNEGNTAGPPSFAFCPFLLQSPSTPHPLLSLPNLAAVPEHEHAGLFSFKTVSKLALGLLNSY